MSDQGPSTETTSSVTAHEETVGRPVSKKEIPPEVQAKIERNRQAALERRAKHQRRLDSEQAIAWEFDGQDASGSNKDGRISTASIIEKNAQLIHKAVAAEEPLPKNEWTKFYDYDLSKMKDTRAGFIQELDEKDKIGSKDEGEENKKKRKWQPTLQQPDPCE